MAAFSDLITFSRAGTATYFDKFGTLQTAANNVPRFDYDPDSLARRGLLIEGARTNLCINSEAIGASTGTSVNSDAGIAPNGAATADLLIETAVNSEHYGTDFSFTPTAGLQYVWSVFVRQGPGTRNLHLRIAGGNNAVVNFNLSTRVMTTSGAQFVKAAYQAMPNGYFRVTLTWTATNATSTTCRIQLANGVATTSYLGDGTSGLYVWGRQLEQGEFPSSYIATTAASVTRAADVVAVASVSPWFNSSEGVLFAEGIYNSFGSTAQGFTAALRHTVSSGSVRLRRSGAAAPTPVADVLNDSASVIASISLNPAMTEGAPIRQAISFAAASFQGSARGVSGTRVTSGAVPALNQLVLGSTNATGGSPLFGWLRRVRYYPTQMADAQLNALTA